MRGCRRAEAIRALGIIFQMMYSFLTRFILITGLDRLDYGSMLIHDDSCIAHRISAQLPRQAVDTSRKHLPLGTLSAVGEFRNLRMKRQPEPAPVRSPNDRSR